MFNRTRLLLIVVDKGRLGALHYVYDQEVYTRPYIAEQMAQAGKEYSSEPQFADPATPMGIFEHTYHQLHTEGVANTRAADILALNAVTSQVSEQVARDEWDLNEGLTWLQIPTRVVSDDNLFHILTALVQPSDLASAAVIRNIDADALQTQHEGLQNMFGLLN